MNDFPSTSDVNIGNTEQFEDTPNIDIGQIIESGDDTRETHQINNWEQNEDIELQHSAITNDHAIVRIVHDDGERNIQEVPDLPIDLHTSSNSKFVFILL